MFADKEVDRYADNKALEPFNDTIKIKKSGEIELTIQPNGGIILSKEL